MKKILLLLVLMLTALPGMSFTFNGVEYYILDSTAKTASTSNGHQGTGSFGIGTKIYPGNTVTGDLVIPETVTYEGETYTVVQIGTYGFYGNGGLTSITLPKTITNINKEAFYNCNQLGKVVIKDLKAWCEIEFANQTSNPCYYSKHLYLDNEEITELIIPNDITKIGSYSFFNLENIKKVVLPYTGLNSIGEYAFYNTGIESVSIPNSVTTIESRTFAYCSSLANVEIPNSVTSIGTYAFRGCNLTSIEIPNSINVINDGVFNECSVLKEVIFEDGEEPLKLGYHTFTNNGTGKGLFADCPLEILHLGRQIEYIDSSWETKPASFGYSAFAEQSNLDKLTLGKFLKSINPYLFYKCTGLKSIYFPESINEIGTYAFYNCKELTELVIPDNINRVDNYAFYGLSNLKSLCIGRNIEFYPYYTFGTIPSLEECIILSSEYSYLSHFNNTGFINLKKVISPQTLSNKTNSFDLYKCSENAKYIDGYVNDNGKLAFASIFLQDDISLPEWATSIGSDAFLYCDGITSFKIDNNKAVYLEEDALNGLSKVIFDQNWTNDQASVVSSPCDITFTENVTSIPPYAFYDNQLLTEINLPSSIKSIGDNSFANCFNLSTINSLAEHAPTIYQTSFEGIYDSAVVNIPEGSFESYMAPSSWWYLFNSFASHDGLVPVVSFEYEGLAYRIVSSSEVEIVRSDKYAELSEIVVPSEAIFIDEDSSEPEEKEFAVVGIADNAFSSFKNVTEVKLPSTIRYIGSSAFMDCVSLSSVELEEGIEEIKPLTFKGCSSLLSIDLPSSVQTIGSKAFYGCGSLEKLVMGSSVSSIGSMAFYNCKALSDIVWSETLKEIGNSAFENCESIPTLDMPQSLIAVGDKAFMSCSSVSTLTLDKKISRIGDSTFKGCVAMKTLTLSEVENCTIGAHAFEGCTQINSIKIPSGYSEIGDYAFWTNEATPSTSGIVIGKDVKSIGEHAFDGQSRVRTFAIEENSLLETIGDNAFSNMSRVSGDLILPASVTYIGNEAFLKAHFEKVVLPANELLSIGDRAFHNCSNMVDIEFEGKIKSIGSYAFAECSAITELELTAQTIGDYVFSNCVKLEKAVIESDIFGLGLVSGCSQLNKMTLRGNSIVDGSTFKNCDALSSLILDVKEIKEESFRDYEVLTDVDFSGRVETIGNYAFYNCRNLVELNFGPKIKYIGQYAFSLDYNNQNPSSIQKIAFASVEENDPQIEIDLYAFYKLSNLRELYLGNRMKTVRNYNFNNVSGDAYSLILYVIDLGSSIEVFEGNLPMCSNMKIPGSLKAVKLSGGYGSGSYHCDNWDIEYSPDPLEVSYGFGQYTYPPTSSYLYSVMNVDRPIIVKNTALTNPLTVRQLNFSDNENLKWTMDDNLKGFFRRVENIYIGNSIKAIDSPVLPIENISGNVIFNEGIQEINSEALAALNVRNIKLPSSLKTITGSGIKLGSYVESLVLADGGPEELNIMSDGTVSTNNTLQHLYIGRNINNGENVDGFSFKNFTGLQNVVIGNDESATVTKIPAYLFNSCTSLRQAILSDKITNIGVSAFDGCSNLEVLVLPANIKEMGEFAYRGCENMKRIVSRSMVPLSGDSYFSRNVIENVPVYVPDEAFDAYWDSNAFWEFDDYDNLRTFSGNVATYLTADEVEELDNAEVGSSIDLGTLANVTYNYDKVDTSSKKVKSRISNNNEEFGLYWFSPNPDAATITQEGVLTVLKDEPAEIWAYALDGSDKKAVIGLNQIMVGDLNSDRKVNTVDLEMMIGHIAAPAGSTIKLKAADINGDGIINTVDLEMMIENIANEN